MTRVSNEDKSSSSSRRPLSLSLVRRPFLCLFCLSVSLPYSNSCSCSHSLACLSLESGRKQLLTIDLIVGARKCAAVAVFVVAASCLAHGFSCSRCLSFLFSSAHNIQTGLCPLTTNSPPFRLGLIFHHTACSFLLFVLLICLKRISVLVTSLSKTPSPPHRPMAKPSSLMSDNIAVVFVWCRLIY